MRLQAFFAQNLKIKDCVSDILIRLKPRAVRIAVAVSLILFAAGHLNAQQNPYNPNWSAYTDYISTTFGITNSMPKQFIDQDQYYVLRPIREDRLMGPGGMYGPVLQTKDKECVVMYPADPLYFSREDVDRAKKTVMMNQLLDGDSSAVKPQNIKIGSVNPRGQIKGEVLAAMGLLDNSEKQLNDSVRFEFDEHVTIIAGKKAKEMFNADSIYIYDLPLQKPYQQTYTYRTGMILTKQDRATLVFKLFFTQKGKENEEQYIDMLHNHIWYRKDFKHNK